MTDTSVNALVTADSLRESFVANLRARDEYETRKNSAQQITAKLIRYFKFLQIDAKSLEANNTRAFESLANASAIQSFDFLNNSVKSDQLFNVYAAEKVASKLESIVRDSIVRASSVSQKFCIAAVMTCFAHRESDSFTFTRTHAKAMLTRAERRLHAMRDKDFHATFNVDESTASTQISSSFRALEALNVLTFDESERARKVVSRVDYEHAFMKLMLSTLASDS